MVRRVEAKVVVLRFTDVRWGFTSLSESHAARGFVSTHADRTRRPLAQDKHRTSVSSREMRVTE
jgi:hypothetical protein